MKEQAEIKVTNFSIFEKFWKESGFNNRGINISKAQLNGRDIEKANTCVIYLDANKIFVTIKSINFDPDSEEELVGLQFPDTASVSGYIDTEGMDSELSLTNSRDRLYIEFNLDSEDHSIFTRLDKEDE